MRNKRLLLSLISLLLFSLVSPVRGQDDGDGEEPTAPDVATVLDVLDADSASYSTLRTALDAAGFSTLLQTNGPFTLLAPDNAAFDALSATLNTDTDSLLADVALLQQVLLYHIVPGDLDTETALTLIEQQVATALSGAALPISGDEGALMLGAATVQGNATVTTNGRVYPIDVVLLPETNVGSTDTFFEVALSDAQSIAQTTAPADGDTTIALTLNSLIQAAGYDDILGGQGLYTVFAPTDTALLRTADRLDGGAAEILDDPQRARELLSYHVVPGVYTVADLQTMERVFLGTTLNGRFLSVVFEDDSLFVNDAPVTTADIVTTNGIIHFIDAVLFPVALAPDAMDTDDATTDAPETTSAPPDAANPTDDAGFVPVTDTVTLGAGDASASIATLVANTPDLETLLAAVAGAGMTDLLDQTGPYTVFAPTDAAFDAYLAAEGLDADAVLQDVDLLAELVLYHIVPGRFDAARLAAATGNELATALPGATLLITAEGIAGATISTSDVRASNGVVHIVDAVLVPDQSGAFDSLLLAETAGNVVSSIAEADTFSLFMSALTNTGLDATLAAGGPYTLFVPTNDALSGFLVQTGVSRAAFLTNEALATQIILYHIVPYRFMPETLPVGDAALYGTLVPNAELSISRDATDTDIIFVNAAQVSGEALTSSNGVVYPIDDVLVPNTQ